MVNTLVPRKTHPGALTTTTIPIALAAVALPYTPLRSLWGLFPLRMDFRHR